MPASFKNQPLSTTNTSLQPGAADQRSRNRFGPRLAQAAAPVNALEPDGTSGLGHVASAPEAMVPDGLSAEGWSSIRRQIRLGRYAAHADDGGYVSANLAHGLNIAYRRDGTSELSPRKNDGESLRLGLRLTGGYQRLHPVAAPEALEGEARTLTYERDRGLTEWWVNGPRGVEQWFKLESPPAGGERTGLLRLALAVSGDFEATRRDGTGQVPSLPMYKSRMGSSWRNWSRVGLRPSTCSTSRTRR